MYEAYVDYLHFNHVIGIADVGQLNRAVEKSRSAELINVAEALHDKKIAAIADDITSRYRTGGSTCGAHCRAFIVGQDNHHETSGHLSDDQSIEAQDDFARQLFREP